MSHDLELLANGAVLLFVITTMLAMGLSLTVPQILTPLRDMRLVALALVANFALVPALAFVLIHVIPLSQSLQTGLILLGTAAGAPFLPKLAQFAHGNVAFSVGLMVLLMVISIFYLPLALPLLLPGVQVDSLSITASLVLTMLLPLGIALFVRARYPEPAGSLRHPMGQASNVALLLVLVTSLLANFQEIIGVIGTGGIVAALVLIIGSVVFGYLLGGPGADTRVVLGLGTGQRNISAALLIATQSFNDTQALAMVLVGSTLGLFTLLPLAFELGRRATHTAEAGGEIKNEVKNEVKNKNPRADTPETPTPDTPSGTAPAA